MIRRTIEIALFALCVTPVFAQPSVSIKSEATPREIYIGDPVAFRLQITISSDVALAPIAPVQNIGAFDVLALSSPTMRTEKDGKNTIAYQFLLTVYSTGSQTIPAIPLQFATVDGSTASAQSQDIEINVKSLLAEKGDEGNLRPLKGLFDFKSYLWIWVLIGLFIATIGGYLGWRWFNLHRRKISGEPEGPPRPPEELAWEAIHKLEDADLIHSGQIKEFYYQLSVILRDYLERRYRLSALDRTTSELLSEFRRQNFDSALTSIGRDFFENADLVKFAKFTPGENEVTDDLNRVKQFINLTTPKKQETGPAPHEEIPV